MLLRMPDDSFEDFTERARSWFHERREIVLATAQSCASYLSANDAPYDFFGVIQSGGEKIAPSFPKVSPFIDLENRNNARYRAIASGLCEILGQLAERDILRNDFEMWHFLRDPAIALFRDLEFHRLRPWETDNTIEAVRRRYYPSEKAGGKALHRFTEKVMTPFTEAGLVDAQKQSKGYQVVSGPVLTAFTDIALIPFIKEREI
jgi:hypothetical protein